MFETYCPCPKSSAFCPACELLADLWRIVVDWSGVSVPANVAREFPRDVRRQLICAITDCIGVGVRIQARVVAEVGERWLESIGELATDLASD